MQKIINVEKSDLFDVLAYVAYARLPDGGVVGVVSSGIGAWL